MDHEWRRNGIGWEGGSAMDNEWRRSGYGARKACLLV